MIDLDASQWLGFLRDAEARLVVYDRDAPSTESPIGVLTGTRPILVTAPHSARHWRDGDWKQEDEYTAALAYLLHCLLDVHVVYARYQLTPDPHDDGDHNLFKRALHRLVRIEPVSLALDLHGARGDRDFAVAIGTIGGRTFERYEAPLIESFVTHGFTLEAATSLDRLAVNLPRYMGGAVQPTITRYLWEQQGIPAVQIELSAWVRVVARLPSATNAKNSTSPDFRGEPGRILRVASALVAFLQRSLG